MNAYEIEYYKACPFGSDLLKYCERDIKAMQSGAPVEELLFHTTDQLRHRMVRKYAWAVPNDQALRAIVQASPIVEMGAGLGYWAKLLDERGARVVAFDQVKPKRWNQGGVPWFPVKVGGPPRLQRYPDHALLLVWPPYRTKMASQALKYFTGNRLFYVGEGASGCTGNELFHVLLDRDWIATDIITIPQWPGLHDQLYVLERKEPVLVRAASSQVRKISLAVQE